MAYCSLFFSALSTSSCSQCRLPARCITTAPPGSGKNSTAVNIWARPLSTGAVAFVFINAGSANVTELVCDADCMQRAGVTSPTIHVRDLWAHQDLGIMPGTSLTAHNLVADGGHSMLLVTPVSA